MFTTKTILLSAFAALAVAAPASAASPDVFSVISTHSGDENVHLRAVSANGARFYLNEASSAYCPNITSLDCSDYGNATVFEYSAASQTLNLATSLPGGQQVYVTADGELAYTLPHSASTGNGSSVSPFEYTPQTDANSVGTLTFDGDAFSACPTEGDVYQLFAGAVAASNASCIGVGFATSEFSGKTAYEY